MTSGWSALGNQNQRQSMPRQGQVVQIGEADNQDKIDEPVTIRIGRELPLRVTWCGVFTAIVRERRDMQNITAATTHQIPENLANVPESHPS